MSPPRTRGDWGLCRHSQGIKTSVSGLVDTVEKSRPKLAVLEDLGLCSGSLLSSEPCFMRNRVWSSLYNTAPCRLSCWLRIGLLSCGSLREQQSFFFFFKSRFLFLFCPSPWALQGSALFSLSRSIFGIILQFHSWPSWRFIFLPWNRRMFQANKLFGRHWVKGTVEL